jgi:hypothetical protein
MPIMTIPDNFRETFATSFAEVVQQKQSRMRKFASVRTGLTGTGPEISHVMPIDLQETTGQRYKKVTLKDLESQSRWYYPREFQGETGDSKWDEKLLAPKVMPGGTHVKAHTAAYNRKVDRVFLDGLLGPSYQGKTGSAQVDLPATQIVPVDFVHTGADADSGLTVPKIIEAVRILKANEAWNQDVRAMGIKLCGVIDSTEEARLKQQANASSGDRLFSKDYDPPIYDENGTLIYWLGVHWVSLEGLLTASVTGASGSVTAKKCAIWTSDAVELGFWADLAVSVDIRPDLSNAVQYLSQAMLGSGREQEEKVVQINCKDS